MEPDFNFTRIGDQRLPGKLYLRASSPPWNLHRHIELRMAVIDGHKTTVATSLTLVESDQDGVDAPAFLTLSAEMGQQLMDQLWDCGLRPSEGAGSAGQMASVQAHLADMRAIAANRLGLELPTSQRSNP
jgi:hypothetical protein